MSAQELPADSPEWLQTIVDAHRTFFRGTPRRIVDVGSRDGNDAAWLRRQLGADTVYCIDARRAAVKTIEKRHPDVIAVWAAVSDVSGPAEFVEFVDEEFAGSSSLELRRAQAYAAESRIVPVQTVRLDEALPPGSLDIVKIDVEGHALPVLRGLGDRLADVRVLHVETETHERAAWGEPANNLEVATKLRAAGFWLHAVRYPWGPSIEDQTWVNCRRVSAATLFARLSREPRLLGEDTP